MWKPSGEGDANWKENGRIVPQNAFGRKATAAGAYFGQDAGGIVERLLEEQLSDGGWNCEAPNGSRRSAFNTTICVLEALLEHKRASGGSPEVSEARLHGRSTCAAQASPPRNG